MPSGQGNGIEGGGTGLAVTGSDETVIKVKVVLVNPCGNAEQGRCLVGAFGHQRLQEAGRLLDRNADDPGGYTQVLEAQHDPRCRESGPRSQKERCRMLRGVAELVSEFARGAGGSGGGKRSRPPGRWMT